MSKHNIRAQYIASSMHQTREDVDDTSSEAGSNPSPDDMDVLREEEDRERLLSRPGLFAGIGGMSAREEVYIGSRPKQRDYRKRKHNRLHRPTVDEDSEERIGYSSDDSFANEDDRILTGSSGGRRTAADEHNEKPSHKLSQRVPSKRYVLIIVVSLTIFLVLLLVFAFELSNGHSIERQKTIPFHQTTTSNGTQDYHPTTILISLDGFRPDYLHRNLTPVLQSLVDSGVSAPYMIPSFPSVTFPNHWTLVTGLYPESHGVVGNTFYDPRSAKEFYYTNTTIATDPAWYGGSPLWSIAEQNGLRTAVHMWPGSEVYLFHPEAFVTNLKDYYSHQKEKPMAPRYVDKWVKNEALQKKSNRILEWLDLPLLERPQLIFSYVPNIDAVGHMFGPESNEEDQELRAVDQMLGSLFMGLATRNLTDIVNVIVVSDHGMAQSSNDRLIYLDDIIGEELHGQILNIEGWPLTGLRFRDGTNVTAVYEIIEKIHKTWPPNSSTGKKAVLSTNSAPWDVYLRDNNMPSRFHFAQNERIAPLWLFPQVGWTFVDKMEYPPDKFPKNGYHPKGVHGYDNQAVDMRAVFFAQGPGFKNVGSNLSGKPFGRRVQPFENVEIYSIIAELVLGSDVHNQGILSAHNGTLGGIKGFAPYVDSSPSSSAISTSTVSVNRPIIQTISHSYSLDEASTLWLSSTITPSVTTVVTTADSSIPTVTDTPTADHKPDSMSWWEWVKWRAQHLKDQMESWWGKVWEEGDNGSQ